MNWTALSRDRYSHRRQTPTSRKQKSTLWVTRLEDKITPAAFTPGDIVVERIGDATTAPSSAATPVYLDEYTTAGVFVQSIALPTTVAGAQRRLEASGTATSEGLVSRSADGQYLLLAGYDAATGTAAVAGTAP